MMTTMTRNLRILLQEEVPGDGNPGGPGDGKPPHPPEADLFFTVSSQQDTVLLCLPRIPVYWTHNPIFQLEASGGP